MTEQEKIELLNNLTICYEFSKNDVPTVVVLYKDENNRVYVLDVKHKNEGVINIGREYKECMQRYGDKK